jgi:hypothetical protein
MKKLLLFALCLAPIALFAQSPVIGGNGVLYVSAAPSGTCNAWSLAEFVVPAGSLYTCQSGTWAQVSGSGGGVSTASLPLAITGANIAISQANGLTNGYLSSTDWSTFNGKQAALSLLAGTYVDGDMCTYALSGTRLNCNTVIPTTFPGFGTTSSTAAVGNDPRITGALPKSGGTMIGPIYLPSEYSNGVCTTVSFPIANTNGQRQSFTITASDTCPLTFTNPSSSTLTIQLKVISPASGVGQISGCSYYNNGSGYTSTPWTLTETGSVPFFIVVYLDGTSSYCSLAQ